MQGFKKAVIAFISPGGTTGKVAGAIRSEVLKHGLEAEVFEIGKKQSLEPVLKALKEEGVLFFPGSPVYANHPLPSIMELIGECDGSDKISAVPFVTWGCVTSGIALYKMGEALKNNNFIISGGLKVPSVHSLMWTMDEIYGNGLPSKKEDELIGEFIDKLFKSLNHEKELSPEDLLYQPENIKEEMEKASVYGARQALPEKILSVEKCIQCGICSEFCPVDAIELSPFPKFLDNCIACYECVKKCPQNALESDFSNSKTRMQTRKESFMEEERAVYFLK